MKQNAKPEHKKLAAYCRSLGLPARVAIVEAIAKNKSCVINDLATIDLVAKATVMEHLRNLKKEGIVKGSVTRSKACYCIDWDKLDEFKLLFDELYNQVKSHQESVSSNNEKCK